MLLEILVLFFIISYRYIYPFISYIDHRYVVLHYSIRKKIKRYEMYYMILFVGMSYALSNRIEYYLVLSNAIPYTMHAMALLYILATA